MKNQRKEEEEAVGSDYINLEDSAALTEDDEVTDMGGNVEETEEGDEDDDIGDTSQIPICPAQFTYGLNTYPKNPKDLFGIGSSIDVMDRWSHIYVPRRRPKALFIFPRVNQVRRNLRKRLESVLCVANQSQPRQQQRQRQSLR